MRAFGPTKQNVGSTSTPRFCGEGHLRPHEVDFIGKAAVGPMKLLHGGSRPLTRKRPDATLLIRAPILPSRLEFRSLHIWQTSIIAGPYCPSRRFSSKAKKESVGHSRQQCEDAEAEEEI